MIRVTIGLPKNLLLLFIVVTIAIATSPCTYAFENLLVTPAEVYLGEADASIKAVAEFTGGISIFVNMDATQTSPPISVSLTQPLIHRFTGKLLSPSQVLVGIDDLQPLQSNLIFPVPPQGLLGLRVAVSLNPFDTPGLYEGMLRITSSTNCVDLPITIEALPWASAKLAVAETNLISNGEPPGPNATLSTGKNMILWVASNTQWSLILTPSHNLVSTSVFEQSSIPVSDIKIRIFSSDWVSPIYGDYVRVSESPIQLAHGKPTGTYGDGWVPVIADIELPFTRNQSAGYYSGSLGFEVCPQ